MGSPLAMKHSLRHRYEHEENVSSLSTQHYPAGYDHPDSKPSDVTQSTCLLSACQKHQENNPRYIQDQKAENETCLKSKHASKLTQAPHLSSWLCLDCGICAMRAWKCGQVFTRLVFFQSCSIEFAGQNTTAVCGGSGGRSIDWRTTMHSLKHVYMDNNTQHFFETALKHETILQDADLKIDLWNKTLKTLSMRRLTDATVVLISSYCPLFHVRAFLPWILTKCGQAAFVNQTTKGGNDLRVSVQNPVHSSFLDSLGFTPFNVRIYHQTISDSHLTFASRMHEGDLFV